MQEPDNRGFGTLASDMRRGWGRHGVPVYRVWHTSEGDRLPGHGRPTMRGGRIFRGFGDKKLSHGGGGDVLMAYMAAVVRTQTLQSRKFRVEAPSAKRREVLGELHEVWLHATTKPLVRRPCHG